MSFAKLLEQMMSGYDISDEESERLAREFEHREAKQIACREWEVEWRKQQQKEMERGWHEEMEIETFGHVLPEFVVGMPYALYLDTWDWRRIANLIKERDEDRCRVCESTVKLNVHHRTYAHIYNELSYLDDLVTLCEVCHKAHHARKIDIEKLINLPPIGRCV